MGTSRGAAPGRRTQKFAAGRIIPLAGCPSARDRLGAWERMGDASSSSWPSTGAAAAYDYERDPRWAEYRASSAVLPHLFSHPYVRAQLQQKFYRRFVVRTTPLHSTTPQFSRLCAPPVACDLHFG